LHNCRKGFRVEAFGPYQGTVDFCFGHERFHIFGLDRSSVKDAEVCGEVIAEGLGGFSADKAMGLGGELRRRGLAGSDSPHRFVGDDEPRGFFPGYGVESTQALATKDIFSQSSFSFFQHFTNADDGRESSLESSFEFEVHNVIGFTEVLAALRMADDYMGAADGEQHAWANLSGKGAFRFP